MTRRTLTLRSATNGFTLIEIMVALGILGFGLLTLSVMQLHAIQGGSMGRHTGDAAAIARSYLEQAHRLPWTVLDVAQAAGTWVVPAWAGTPAASTSVDLPGGAGSSVEHAYTVNWFVSDVGAAPICLRDIQVRVTWGEVKHTVPKSSIVATRRYNWGDPSC